MHLHLGPPGEFVTSAAKLSVSAWACNTAQLLDKATEHSFECLEVLEFGPYSLLNYGTEGFDEHEAASYITAILPSLTASITFAHSPNWINKTKTSRVRRLDAAAGSSTRAPV